MREMRMAMLLCGAGIVMLGVLGCKHPPELKPPPSPEILASPGDDDKRYTLPCSYPSDVMGDPKGLNSGITPAGKRGGGTGGGAMGGTGMGGMSSGGMQGAGGMSGGGY